MYNLRKIESFDLPELQPYRTMRRQHEHREQGIFVAEGEKVVRRLLESKFSVVSVLLPEKWLLDLEPLLQARVEQIQVFVAEKALLETLTGFSMYQGLLAVGKVPAMPTLAEVVARSSQPRLLAAADGLSSAENLGALVRNCAAFSAQALIVGETCSSPFLRRAVRSSMGTIFQMPIVETTSLSRRSATCANGAFAASPPIRMLTVGPFRRPVSRATAASCSAAKAMAFRPPCWPPATRPWPSPCRRRWIRSTSAAPPQCSSTKPIASAAS